MTTEQSQDLEKVTGERDLLQSALDLARERIKEQRSQIEKLNDHADELQDKVEKLTDQVEELQVSPLDLTQQQRVKALTASRDVVAETSSANIFSKSGTKVSLAGVVSTAHFIITGERDYVVGEGEFIQRQNDDPSSSAETVEPVGPGGIAPLSDAELNQVGITRTEGGDHE